LKPDWWWWEGDTDGGECADDGDAAGAGEGCVCGVVVLEDAEGEAEAWGRVLVGEG
jgi:hypothetical protein